MTLPDFSLSARVATEQARQDRIDLTIGNWIIQGHHEDFPGFFDRLGPRPNVLEDNPLVHRQDDNWGNLFNRPTGPIRQSPEMHISTGGRGRARQSGAPLFRGTLRSTRWELAYEQNDSTRYTARRLLAELSLNPTRYVVHQPLWRPRPGASPENWVLPAAHMQSRRIRTRVGEEFPLEHFRT